MGRPPKLTEEVVKLLEDAFKLDAPVTEACQYAGISRTAYYDYVKAHPEFLDRLERLKSMTRFKIRGKVISRALKDPNFGLNYLKLKCDDFKEKKQVEAEVKTKLNAADSLIRALGQRGEDSGEAENGGVQQ
jgi:predicted DNA-binding protein YlxM (UPF0122 family)